jgi:valyl-tRNA synthetase
MQEKLLKPYDPKATEEKIYKLWEKSGYFNPDKLPGERKKNYTIMMAPPNITGHIHVGHALENTLSDILIRQKRMQGYKVLFLPGKDHAGIAAQYVVEKELKKEGKTRFDLGKEKFLERMWQWMEEYGKNIDKELKKLGLSCDWSRKRFTMDKNYQKAVIEAFNYYKKKGWIYRGKRMVNWCSRCQTNISDLEVEYREEKGKLYYIKYPVASKLVARLSDYSRLTTQDYIVVATTRPETMLGDSAVAVNPKDKRYKNLIGKIAVLPIKNREIPIVADDLVDKNFGTGAVKITPCHDMVDFEIAKKNGLPFYYIIDEKGRMTDEAAPCERLSVKKCREKILSILKDSGLLEKEKDYVHNVGVCERCKTIIEPLISEQWFLSMKELSKLAINAAQKNKIKFIPSTRKKIFINWFKNVKDWNISRQLWWGHKIPLKEEEDVLDTWFSSALWSFATLGWPQKSKDLKEFYPTDLISSAREIFFLWIGRMVFSGMEFMKEVPFYIAYTHPTILDKHGRKMSKSLGNVVDPMELINKYGVDATRFGLIWQTSGHQDTHWSEDALIAGKKFCNKLWNISRFVLEQIGKSKLQITNYKQISKSKSQKEDKQILEKLEKITQSVNKDLESYKFGQALHTIYDFVWHDFADNYIEYSKSNKSDETLHTLYFILYTILKLLHPFVPFITEEIWSMLPIKKKEKKLLIIEQWPKT